MKSESILCFDCNVDLKNVDTWEPFLHRCYCGDWEHVRLCTACICDLDTAGSSLHYAYVANGYTSYGYIFRDTCDDCGHDISAHDVHDCAEDANCSHDDRLHETCVDE